jgi:scyllo-inositol 2-dehydrogenase (NAD+)
MALNIGLVGAGRMGSTLAHHLAFSVESANLVAVADLSLENARKVAAACRVADVYADDRALLARDDLDAVVVATPTNSHVAVIKAAAQSGRHIFTEKPLALTLEQCDEALAAVEAAGVKMMVGFMRRFDPAYQDAKAKIDAGAIGQPVMIKLVGRDPWRTSLEFARRENSGGMIADMGVHEFDLARWLMGSEVVRASSEGDCLVFPELSEVGDIDNALVNLKFASGALGNVDLSRNAVYGYDIRTEVIGSQGSLFIGGLQHTMVWTLKQNQVSHDTIPGFMERFGPAYAAELRAFVDCVLQDQPVPVTGSDARRATAIAVAATRSLDEGRPVALAEIGGQ